LLPCRTSIWTRLFNLVCGKVCLEEVTIMRKLIFIGIVAVGALVGLLSAAQDDWATRMVMSAVGALFA
jgi:hypothetical protein